MSATQITQIPVDRINSHQHNPRRDLGDHDHRDGIVDPEEGRVLPEQGRQDEKGDDQQVDDQDGDPELDRRARGPVIEGAQAGLQAARVLCIGTANYPDGTCLPALDHLAQQESAPQQFLQAALVNHRLAGTQDLSRVRREEISRLTLDLAQMTREAFVFTRREQIR